MFEARLINYTRLVKDLPIRDGVTGLVEMAHSDQFYGEHSYIEEHIFPVTLHSVSMVDDFNLGTGAEIPLEDTYIVASLHDAIEDGPEGIEDEITGILALYGKDYLLSSILWLTKPEGILYNDYIDSILDSGDLLAIIVKCADMELNNYHSGGKRKKYSENLPKLQGHIKDLIRRS